MDRATGVLHCNLNVRSMTAAAAVYTDLLGFRVGMRSHAEGMDATSLGLPRPTDSDTLFLYDHRGGRVAPAIELVEWLDPRTTGDVYDDIATPGLQGLGFDVPRQFSGLSARPVEITGVDVVAADADGVNLELKFVDVDAPTLRYVRLVCRDLDASAGWWERIGFAAATSGTVTVGTLVGTEQVMVLDGRPPLDVRLTTFDMVGGQAHDQPHHRGLFRLALAVADCRAAAAACGVDAEAPAFMELPGTPLGGVWMSVLTDPDGILVEFVEREMPDA